MKSLLNPHSARVVDDKLVGVTFQRNMLQDEEDTNGKPKIAAIPGTEEEFPCDTLIVAFGQSKDLGIFPDDVRHTEGHLTSHDKVFVAGDFNEVSMSSLLCRMARTPLKKSTWC
ncbi:MAG: hypothetical protein GXP30_12020 [Verrucomicrobia bacterium]|nr:hypothetical protein [Verrucomicrobiota bacterium]